MVPAVSQVTLEAIVFAVLLVVHLRRSVYGMLVYRWERLQAFDIPPTFKVKLEPATLSQEAAATAS